MAGFDPDAYLKSTPAFDPDAYLKDQAPGEDVEPADHGLSERQKLSPMGKALSPITGYWPTYQRMRGEAYNQAAEGIHQMTNPDSLIDPQAHGIADVGMGALKTAAGGFNYLLGSPVNAAYRSIIGQPLEDTTGIPREYSEFAAQLATPGLGFGKMPTAPGTVADAGAVARAAGRPGETAGIADGSAPNIRTLEGPDLNTPTAQANRKLAKEFEIPLTRGQATEDSDAIRFEDMASRNSYGKEMQDVAQPAFENQFQKIQDAGQRIGQQVNRGEQPLDTPASAATSLNTEIGDRAAAARAARDSEVSAAQTQEQAQRGAVAEQGQTIGEAISAAHGEVENPRAAGEIVNRDVRNAAAAHREDFKAKYDEFGRQEGSLQVNQGLGNSIREQIGLADHPVDVDEGTPVASRALARLDRTTTPADADTPLMFDLKGVDRMRRLLVSDYKKAAYGSEDQRAVRAIMNSYDDHIEKAISDGLFSGDPRALDILREARASYARYQQTFMPQRNDGGVGDAMRRIVQRNATAEETANMIVGTGAIGQAGLPVRLADRLEQVLGADSQAWNSVRQAIWQKASRVTNARGEVDAAKSAQSVDRLAGSTLGQRMFTPEELTAMRNHSRASRDLEGVVASTSTARAERAQATYEQAFGTGELSGKQKQVFQRMIDGTAEPEEISDALFSVIAGGNPSNASRAISSVERIVGADSPVMGNVRQGVWQKLTQHPFGMDQPGQQKLVQSINQFLNGKGKTISEKLYTAEERATMKRYADAVQKTIIDKYAKTNSDTAVARGAQAQRQVAQVASVINSFLHTGPLGHIGGGWVAKKIGEKVGAAAKSKQVEALKDSVTDFVPKDKDGVPIEPPMTTKGNPPRAPSAIKPVPLSRIYVSPDRQREDRP